MKKLLLLLLAVLPLSMFGQTPMGGVVTDSDGSPLPGVNIQVKGTDRGVQSDFDGNFSIALTTGDTLVFSYVGFMLQEVPYSSQQSFAITMEPDTAALDEVVVTGYSKQSTRDVTGSVVVIKSQDLIDTAPTNLEQALQGQASGIVVGSQGAPGAGANVRVRGFGTINGNDPLYIIDGTPTGAGLTNLNPNDIASIQVLKDASSAAIYGNRAANGVIIVTTKGGQKNGKVKFSGNAFLSVDYIPNTAFPDLATPDQLVDSQRRAALNDGLTPVSVQFGDLSNPTLPNYTVPVGTNSIDESLYDFETNRITRANKAGTNWFDEYFNTAMVQSYNMNASGGGENSSFFMSLNALNQDGVAYETGFERYTLRANSKFSITDRFRMGENVSISYSDQVIPPGTDIDNGPIASIYRIHPIVPVRDVGGNFAGIGSGSGLGNGKNPLAIADRNKDNGIVKLRALGNAFMEYDIIPELTFKTNLGFNLESTNTSDFQPWQLEGEAQINGNSLEEASRLFREYTWFNTLNYSHTFDKHKIGVLAGTEFNKNSSREFKSSRTGFLFNDETNTRYLDLGTGEFNGEGFGSIKAYYSAFGKADYQYNDKYLVSGTIRYDSSSLFNKDNRSGVFPSFSLGWRASEESFMTESSIFTNLMFKLGYGVIGNDGSIDANRRVNVYSPDLDFYTYPNSNSSLSNGYGLNSRGNPDLKWETTTTLNFGFTSRLFDLLNFDFEYYDATTRNMLLSVQGDPTVLGNVNSITRNIGEMNNKGFDVSTSFDNYSGSGDFNYSVGFNLSAYKNEVVFLNPDNLDTFLEGEQLGVQLPNRTQAGQPLASFYGKRVLGVDENGRFEFANDGEQEFIGNPHPDFTYGVNFSADYKDFDISLLMQGSQGNDIYNFLKFYTDFNTFVGPKSQNYINSTGLPALTNDAGIIANESAQSSYYVEDGSYLRLKNIVLGYTLPENLISKLNVERIRLYLQGKNLITLTNYSGLDPEVNFIDSRDSNSNQNLTIGVDSGVYPITRSIILGVNVSF